MPRTQDTYTHGQFESIDHEQFASRSSTTVVCSHCRSWRIAAGNLNAKKIHLSACAPYAEWRAAGNGEELAPTHLYYSKKAHESAIHGQDRPDGLGPFVVLTENPKVSKAFEYHQAEGQKITSARCLSCGYTRATNNTRQVEHLLQCREWLESPDGQEAIATQQIGPANMPPVRQDGFLRGTVANPHLSGGRRVAAKPSVSFRPNQGPPPVTPHRQFQTGPPPPAPSLANHLLSRDPDSVNAATQLQFLSHAGCGTLSAPALTQWLAQDAYISRAFMSFIGRLIGKMRLPGTAISMENTTFRVMDLLISTLNNVRREMSFFDNTATKYELQIFPDPPSPATKGLIDLFANASSSGASLLEGLVLLWTVEHCYRSSWHHASTFANNSNNNNNTSSSNYSLPSFMTGAPYSTEGAASASNESHINALHQALIPNWTSPAFSKFVDACRSIVDEVANSMTTGNGREEMQRCEQTFKQALWLWKGIWPEVNGMGVSDELAQESQPPASAQTGAQRDNETNGEPIEIPDDGESGERSVGPDGDDAQAADTPYGGTGLDAVHASNRMS